MSVSRRQLLSGAKPACHISSLVVHCLPESVAAAIAAIEALHHMEVPESDPSGKFVVLMETDDEADIMSGIEQIQEIDGVINATLVYHQIDD